MTKLNTRTITRLAVLLIIAGILLLFFRIITPVSEKTFVREDGNTYTLKRVVDGDTVIVTKQGSELQKTIRLIGIDSPEVSSKYSSVQCYGSEAKAYLEKMVAKSDIRLQTDALVSDKDQYGRLLRYVNIKDSVDVGIELLATGHAFVYQSTFSKNQAYTKQMERAKLQKLGLWNTCGPIQNLRSGQWQSLFIIK